MAAGLALTAAATGALAQGAECLTRLEKVREPPRFKDFPAPVAAPVKPARPRLTSADGRAFRTVLRDGAARGPNFAGHYAVVVWGCGSSCADMAIVDTRSG